MGRLLVFFFTFSAIVIIFFIIASFMHLLTTLSLYAAKATVNSPFGMRETGRAFASRAMIRKLGTKTPTLCTISDGVGDAKSPQGVLRKTDGPLCVNFRRIKQGG